MAGPFSVLSFVVLGGFVFLWSWRIANNASVDLLAGGWTREPQQNRYPQG